MRMKRVLCVCVALAIWAGDAWAGRPLAIDDADPVEPRHFEVEAGLGYYNHDADFTHWDVPLALTYGVVRNLEIGIGFGGQFEERLETLGGNGADERRHLGGIGDLTAGAKWRFLEEKAWWPRLALVPMIKFPTADDDRELGSGKLDYDLTLILSRSLGERVGVHANVGYSWVGEPDGERVGDVIHYGVALDFLIVDALQWVGEVFAEEELLSGSDVVVQFNTGLRWMPVENLILDIAGGSGVCGDAPNYTLTAGLTWTFGLSGVKAKK